MANYSGWQGTAYLERGWSIPWDSRIVQPLTALQYTHVVQNDFSETGAGAANLSGDASDTNSLRGLLGGRLCWTCCMSCGWLVEPNVRATWMHEFLDTDSVLAGVVSAPRVCRRLLPAAWTSAGTGR